MNLKMSILHLHITIFFLYLTYQLQTKEHKILIFWSLVYFPKHNGIQLDPFCCKIQNLIPFIFKDLFIDHKREVGEEFFHLVSLPNGCNDWTWACPKSGVQSFFQVFHMCAGIQGQKPSSLLSQGALVGKWTGRGWTWCPCGGLVPQVIVFSDAPQCQ